MSSRRAVRLALWLATSVYGSALAGQESESLTVPAGFEASVFAERLEGPRGLAFGPGGDLYVTLTRRGSVVRLIDADGDGRADSTVSVIEGLDRPSGIAWRGQELWIAETGRVVRLHRAAIEARAAPPPPEVVIDSLPAGGQHFTRTIVFDPSGRYVLVSIGSSCNVCREEDPRRAAIVRYPVRGGSGGGGRGGRGGGGEVLARGLRNAVGLAFNPETGELWATDNGRDWLGDDLPPDEVNAVHRGRNYGWPECYGNRVPDPEYGSPARCAGTEPPILTLPAHNAPLGIAFYTGSAFPEDYHGDAFIALHGSWNRSVRSGYKVVRVRVRSGRPVAAQDFVSGWLTQGGLVWGRPVQPLVGPDGALYLTDDYGGRIWRIVYEGQR